MLDDFSHEMDNTDTKMDSVMKKMAKVLHMSNGIYMNFKINHSFEVQLEMNFNFCFNAFLCIF